MINKEITTLVLDGEDGVVKSRMAVTNLLRCALLYFGCFEGQFNVVTHVYIVIYHLERKLAVSSQPWTILILMTVLTGGIFKTT